MSTHGDGQSNMSEQKDLDELFSKIKSSAKDTLDTVRSIADHEAIQNGSNSKGISLLGVKNQLMIQYMLDLTLILQRKVAGQSIQDHPAIWRMIENRTFLEKMRPIEQKMKYQIDKLVKKAKFGETGESDRLGFKPNLDNFQVGSEDESDEDEEKDEDEDDEKKKAGVYKAPKLAPVRYIGDETVEEREQRKLEKLKKRALSTTMMEELRRDYMEEPEEIVESRDLHRIKRDKQRKEREDYEENYFVRTSVSKKEKNKGKRMATISSLDGLLKFDNLNYLDNNAQMDEPMAKKKKSSKGLKGKGKKGKGMRRKWRH